MLLDFTKSSWLFRMMSFNQQMFTDGLRNMEEDIVNNVVSNLSSDDLTLFIYWGRDKMATNFLTTFSKCIFLNEEVWIWIKIWLKIVPKGAINNIPALVQIMAWRQPGNKPLSEPMVVSLLTHIYVTQPQWVKWIKTYRHTDDYVTALYAHMYLKGYMKNFINVFWA